MHRVIAAVVAAAAFAAPIAALTQEVTSVGNPRRGAALIAHEGCGTCHTIPGIDGARGLVGPPLDTIGKRMIIAGVLPNTPADLIHWLMAPQSVVPGNAMPDMGLSARDAADIAAYLYTLR
ncbi:MAG TPA: c-type cytochrome [Acetobacteraceae bacterium]